MPLWGMHIFWHHGLNKLWEDQASITNIVTRKNETKFIGKNISLKFSLMRRGSCVTSIVVFMLWFAFHVDPWTLGTHSQRYTNSARQWKCSTSTITTKSKNVTVILRFKKGKEVQQELSHSNPTTFLTCQFFEYNMHSQTLVYFCNWLSRNRVHRVFVCYKQILNLQRVFLSILFVRVSVYSGNMYAQCEVREVVCWINQFTQKSTLFARDSSSNIICTATWFVHSTPLLLYTSLSDAFYKAVSFLAWSTSKHCSWLSGANNRGVILIIMTIIRLLIIIIHTFFTCPPTKLVDGDDMNEVW